jgi:hypothetical protein
MQYPQISISELYSMKSNKDKIKINTFNVILNKCHTKIKMIAGQGGMNIFFEVPYVLLGYPLYNITECVEYIVDAIRKNGMLVQILPYPNSNTIYISWRPTDINVKKQLTSSKHPFGM